MRAPAAGATGCGITLQMLWADEVLDAQRQVSADLASPPNFSPGADDKLGWSEFPLGPRARHLCIARSTLPSWRYTGGKWVPARWLRTGAGEVANKGFPQGG